MAAAAVAAGGGIVLAGNMASPSLPDVQVPAIQLSSAEGNDATVQWLDLFAQTSAANADSFGGYLLDPSSAVPPGESPLVLIDPETSAEDFDQILDGVVGNAGSQLNAVTSPSNGRDAVTYLILKNGS
ncbi:MULTISPECIES: hypothetical protein [Mycolicibacter]|uniref:Uncharacterized protein n=1 Tax=Mycolicibacter virginiensis TaxID=1795032 RepID=A0A9X7NYF6_9MYCO|nr:MULTISPECIES: hypothetical protein [Mycobacteriaceae]OBG34172.1 hypothetical protein A5671_04965 [Mycolicibacter heraklionensis]OBJ29230.1 hypothetical protein A5631_18205 [Mycolicibacter heraklionensis]PQM51986.1 hypothetical protein C5U48_12390 [Mycolicibacter virginiensis]ULP45795.1 hypothetical protein MJO54_13015 [Mycolicibacter virginiensis]